MANPRFRHYSVFVGGKKVGQINESTFTTASGDEVQFGDEGVVGFSDGAVTTKLTTQAIVPVSGMDVALETALLSKQDVDIGLGLINGKIWQVTMRTITAEYKADAKAGTLMGSFEFSGGTPRISQ